MTHYSAIASAQAAKKASLQDLKQRNQNTGKSLQLSKAASVAFSLMVKHSGGA